MASTRTPAPRGRGRSAKGSGSTPPANRKRRLNTALILETALSLAERHGANALTVRRLGEELGADPTALYRHFRSKDELLMMLADYLIAQVAAGLPPMERWQDTLAEGARRTVAAFERHPAIAVAISGILTRRDSQPESVEMVLALMKAAGLSDEAALLQYRSGVDFLLAYSAQRAHTSLITEEQRRADAAEWQRRVDAIPPGESPTVARIGRDLFRVSDDAVLENWLRIFIADIERQAGTERRP